jgi:hypothetical protein
VLSVVDAYEDGDLTEIVGAHALAAQYMDAMRWSTRAVKATSKLAAA